MEAQSRPQPIAVLGDLNLDTSVNIYQFPVICQDTMFSIDGIGDLVGGAAANVATGLAALGHEVRFGSVVGADDVGDLVLKRVEAKGLSTAHVRRDWPATSRTVVLVDPQGNRQCINDPKRVHQYRYPEQELEAMLAGSPWVFTSTQNWCRHVARSAKERGHKVAVDVQAIVTDDDYHRDFLRCAQVVILSTERLSMHSHDFIRLLWSRYGTEVVVATHGRDGATLGIRAEQRIEHEPAVDLRPIVDKTGAGDAFAAGFCSALLWGWTYRQALTAGQRTAAYKIGEKGSTNGFPGAQQLQQLCEGRRGP